MTKLRAIWHILLGHGVLFNVTLESPRSVQATSPARWICFVGDTVVTIGAREQLVIEGEQ